MTKQETAATVATPTIDFAAVKAAAAASHGARAGIGAFVRKEIVKCYIANKAVDVKAVLEATKKQFEGAKTTVSCIRWYINELKSDDRKLKEVAEAVAKEQGTTLK